MLDLPNDPHLAVDSRSKPTAGASANDGAAQYRPDIDGLRAIAVASVVAFHAGLKGTPGGFIGVDIFFVISGFLIGGQLYRQVLSGTFSFVGFYTRRVRRILPALIVMLTSMYVAGAVLLTPPELKELGKEAVASTLGLSNIYFYSGGGGYFAPLSDYYPMLMTWSLGVEEQFYLFFPFVVMLAVRLSRVRPAVTLAIVSLVAFLASIPFTYSVQAFAFYLLPTRLWELGIGAVLAMREIDGGTIAPGSSPRPGAATEARGVVGLALILTSLICYDPSIAFPGWFALLPTVGALLVLSAPQSWVCARLLASPVPVFLGRVSYSWYLWHWPLFYLNRVVTGDHSQVPPVMLIAASLALGILSWWLVEQPFRRRVLRPRATLFRYAGVVLATVAVGTGIWRSGGLMWRYTGQGRQFALEAYATQADPCLTHRGVAVADLARCVPPLAPGQQVRLVVMGDSHGSAAGAGFERMAAVNGLGFGMLTKSACAPVWGYSTILIEEPSYTPECLAFQRNSFSYIAAHPEIRVVVLAGRWGTEMMLSGPAGSGHVPLERALDVTVTRLEKLGRRVVLMQDNPVLTFDPYARVMTKHMPARDAAARWLGDAPHDTTRATLAEMEPRRADPILARVASRHPDTIVVDPWNGLCDTAGCRFRDLDHIFYFDGQHLTRSGALAAIPPIVLPRN